VVNLRVNSDTIENIGLVIFDKDGTLINLYDYWSKMVGYRVALAQVKLGFDEDKKKDIMYAMGVDLEKERLRVEGPVGLKKREIVMQAMIEALSKIGFKDSYDLCFKIFKEVDVMSVKHFPEIIKPISGMHQLIDRLYKKNCRIAIATTDKTERAELAMKFLGISDNVDIVVGDDKVENCKPSPDMVNLILGALLIEKNNAVIVGDAITDIEMGIKAGLKAFIGVCSGLTSRERLLVKTNYVVENISNITVLQ
jgi:phosphoglycolate phosphatase